MTYIADLSPLKIDGNMPSASPQDSLYGARRLVAAILELCIDDYLTAVYHAPEIQTVQEVKGRSDFDPQQLEYELGWSAGTVQSLLKIADDGKSSLDTLIRPNCYLEILDRDPEDMAIKMERLAQESIAARRENQHESTTEK